MPTAAEIADTLESAAKILEEHGWCQGVGQKASGERCAVAAVGTAAFGDARIEGRVPADHSLYIESLAELAKRLRKPGKLDAVVRYNDTQGRTVNQVVALMRSTAQDLRAPNKEE